MDVLGLHIEAGALLSEASENKVHRSTIPFGCKGSVVS
jgi:hypothetical protein